MNKNVVLLIEDDETISSYICTVLKNNDYKTIKSHTGSNGLIIVKTYCPDIILLDLGLPDIDGIDLIKEIRTFSQIPIIIISARGDEKEKVHALDLGADDYVTKPFGTQELLARIRTALRHKVDKTQINVSNSIFETDGLTLNFDKRLVLLNGEEIHLTRNEYKILSFLAKNAGKILTYDAISKEVWGQYIENDITGLRVHMANLRRKIEENPAEPKYIFTEVGVGYRLKDQ